MEGAAKDLGKRASRRETATIARMIDRQASRAQNYANPSALKRLACEHPQEVRIAPSSQDNPPTWTGLHPHQVRPHPPFGQELCRNPLI